MDKFASCYILNSFTNLSLILTAGRVLQLQRPRRAVQVSRPHHPPLGVRVCAAGTLGDGRLLAVGPCQQSVETVVSAGVVPLVVTVVDEAGGGERGLVDEERAASGVLFGLTRCGFL